MQEVFLKETLAEKNGQQAPFAGKALNSLRAPAPPPPPHTYTTQSGQPAATAPAQGGAG